MESLGSTCGTLVRRDSVPVAPIDQLVRIYLDKETWHKVKLSEGEAKKYFQRVYDTGNIIIHSVGDLVVGYVESWRVDKEGLERINNGTFSAYLEDIGLGHICYLANIYIEPEFRFSGTILDLKRQLMEKYKDCTVIVGRETIAKSNRRIRIFRGGRYE